MCNCVSEPARLASSKCYAGNRKIEKVYTSLLGKEVEMQSTTFLMFTFEDGGSVAYYDDSEFLVQVGKGKSAYVTKYTFTGNLDKAVTCYDSINLGSGQKKRLLMPSNNKPVLARAFG